MNKKVVILSVISVIVVLIVAIGGYFLWNHFNGKKGANQPVSQEDLIMGEITNTTTLEELIAKLGNPESKREYMDGTTGDKVIECVYDNEKTVITFRDSNNEKGAVIAGASSKNNQYMFARNLKVGSSKEEVVKAFKEESQVYNDTLQRKNQIRFVADPNNANSIGITFTIQKEVVTQISWNG